MKNLNFILLFSFLVFGQIAAQIPIQEKYWVLTDSILLEFNNTGLPSVSTCAFRGNRSFPNSTYADSSGFFCYSTGWYTWDSSNQFMSGSHGTSNPNALIQNSAGIAYILESEVDSDRIIICHDYGSGYTPASQCYYINKTLNGGLGAIVDSMPFINFKSSLNHPVDTVANGPIIIKQGDGSGFWILMKMVENALSSNIPKDTWMTMQFEDDTFSSFYFQNIGDTTRGNQSGLTNLSFSLDGTKFAYANINGVLEVYDFDRCTGLLSNAQRLSPRNYHLPPINVNSSEQGQYLGCAFSNSGQYLYANSRDTLWQFNLYATDIPSSSTILWYDTMNIDSLNLGRMELGPDGRIYLGACDTFFMLFSQTLNILADFNPGNQYNSWLGVVNYPDSVGTGCEFKRHGLYLGGRGTNGILPRTYNTKLGVWVGSPCDPNVTGEAPSKDQNIKLKVYPNPANEKINITWPVQGGFSWVLKSLAGSTLSSGAQLAGNATISTANLPEGMYFLEVHSAKESKVEKVVVLR